jgi:hypothetical protein
MKKPCLGIIPQMIDILTKYFITGWNMETVHVAGINNLLEAFSNIDKMKFFKRLRCRWKGHQWKLVSWKLQTIAPYKAIDIWECQHCTYVKVEETHQTNWEEIFRG